MTEELVGNGGWAEVKVAKFRGIRVAAKCLYPLVCSKHNLLQFEREMSISAELRHPNLLLFIGAILLDPAGPPVILSELMPTCLRNELNTREMPRVHITSIARDVACGLYYLHQWQPYPILHRDISSGNVLLQQSFVNGWRAKVGDYGSANFMNAVATVGPGCPTYAAPEASFPLQHSPKMDVYSFGVLLMEMYLQRLPDTQADLVEQIQFVQWPHNGCHRLSRCISVIPNSRPGMGDVMELLQ